MALLQTELPRSHGRVQIPIDSWRSIEALSGQAMAHDQAEAMVTVLERLLHYRLEQWHGELVGRDRLHQDMYVLRGVLCELDRLHHGAATRLEAEQRARHERIASEMHAAADQIRDMTSASKTDVGLLVNGARAQAKEDSQTLEIARHRLEGKLATSLGAFKSDIEYGKARAMYAFSFFVGVIFLSIIVERTHHSNKEKQKLLAANQRKTSEFTDA